MKILGLIFSLLFLVTCATHHQDSGSEVKTPDLMDVFNVSDDGFEKYKEPPTEVASAQSTEPGKKEDKTTPPKSPKDILI